MSFVAWVVGAALIYAAFGSWLFQLVDSVQRRKLALLPLLVIAPAAAYLIAMPFTRQIAAIEEPVQRAGVMVIAYATVLVVWLRVQSRTTAGKVTWQHVKRRNEIRKQVNLHLALVTGALVFSLPFYWLITTSLKPDDRVSMFPPDLIPMRQERATIGGEERRVYILDRDGREARVAKMAELEGDRWEVRVLGKAGASEVVPSAELRPELHPTALWSNYSEALEFLPPEYNRGLVPLWNTVYVTLLTIAGTILSSSLVAFAFARLRWPGRDLLFVVLLATMMIPPAVTMLPVFLIFRWLNWVDTLKPLWVPALFGSAFNVFLLRQFFMTIPNDLEDAAKIDGCSYFMIYWRIMLPLIKPALAALTIFAFMGSWNNFMGPLIYISSPEKMTLAYALQLFQGTHGGEPAMMMAAATLVMLPVLVVFFFTQRYIIQGVTLTGIKG